MVGKKGKEGKKKGGGDVLEEEVVREKGKEGKKKRKKKWNVLECWVGKK